MKKKKLESGVILKSVLVAALCAVSQTSCGGSSNNSSPSAAPSPGIASPSPSPSPSSTLSWAEVSEISQCTVNPRAYCPTTNGFNVDANGAYSVDSQGASGNVTAGELAQVNTLASQYAASSGLLGFSCQASAPGAPVNATLAITYSDGSTQTVYSTDAASNQTCSLGQFSNATSLYQLIMNLAGKYNPAPAPSRSASP